MVPYGTAHSRHGGLKPITCLDADPHDNENITDKLMHYVGCIQYCDRERYYDSLPEETQLLIKIELRRIEYVRQVIESSKTDKHLATRLNKSLEDWREDPANRLEEVKAWSKTLRPERATSRHHDPNTPRQKRDVKLEDYDPNKDFNAYYIEYFKSKGVTNTLQRANGQFLYKGKFPNQKISMHKLLYDKEINPLSRNRLSRNNQSPHDEHLPQGRETEREKPGDRIRYFHLPANNMKWVEDAIARYYDEENPQYDTAYRKADPPSCATMLLRRDFWLGQEHGRGSPIIHTRHMRPLCEPVSSDPSKVEEKPRNIVLFMPYLHWELDHQRERLQTFVGQRWAHHQDNLKMLEYTRYINRREERAPLSKTRLPARPATYLEGKPTFPRTSNSNRRSTHETNMSDHRRPNDPPEAVNQRVQREPSNRFRHITPQWPRRDANGRLLTGNKLGQLLYDAFKLFEAIDNYRDRRLIDNYLLGEPPLHPRRTLDQAHFWTLRNTKTRDRDQVVYRGTSAKAEMRHHYNPDAPKGNEWSCDKDDIRVTQFETGEQEAEHGRSVLTRLGSRQGWSTMAESALAAVERVSPREQGLPTTEPHNHPSEPSQDGAQPPYVECQTCREAVRKVPRLLMVDQLWMWILDDHTIITCFPKRYGINRQDASGVHKAIRQRLSQIRRNHIRSAYDLALIIIDESSSLFFDRTKTDERQPQVMEIFSEAIGNMAHKQTISSNHLWHWADELARASSKKSSSVDLSALHVALLNITPEGKLQRETKDIIEELDILINITRRQRELLRRFKKHGENLLDRDGAFKASHRDWRPEHLNPESLTRAQRLRSGSDSELYEKWKWFQTNAEEIILEVEDHLEELLGLHSSANAVCKSLDNLLALKQQQASVVVAWQSIRHGEEAVKQGRSIMIFTIITIIFLPLAFMAAIFGMNNHELGENQMTLRVQLKLMFAISVGVIAVVVVIAFSNFIRAVTWSLLHFTINWLLVNTGLYRIWLNAADVLREESLMGWAEREVDMMKERVRKERRRSLALRYETEKQHTLRGQASSMDAPDEQSRRQNGTATSGSHSAARADATGTNDGVGGIELGSQSRPRQNPPP